MTTPDSPAAIRWAMRDGAHALGVASSVWAGVGVVALFPAYMINALVREDQPNWWGVTAPWLAVFDLLVLATWIVGHWIGRLFNRRRGLPPFDLDLGTQIALMGTTVLAPLLPLFFMLAAFKSEPEWVLYLTAATAVLAAVSYVDAHRSSKRAGEVIIRRRLGLPDDAKINTDTSSLIALAEERARKIEVQKRRGQRAGRDEDGSDDATS